jgi:glycosyltransferase involved in cell wall biosynthesis
MTRFPSELPQLSVHIKSSDPGWILERMAQALAQRLPYVTTSIAVNPHAAIQYYLNYNEHPGRRVSPIELANFTHVDEAQPDMKRRYFEVAREVDVAVCMAERYGAELRATGIEVHVIRPGVDLERFTPRVKIGVVGRTYACGRKGEALVAAVLDTPGIEWHFTGSGWPLPSRTLEDSEMPAFYREMDYILVPSLYEGGPMCVIEALACGTQVIAPPIGWVPDFPHIAFRTGDAADLRRVLNAVVGEKLDLRKSVEDVTWDNFAAAHHRLFHALYRARAARARPLPFLARGLSLARRIGSRAIGRVAPNRTNAEPVRLHDEHLPPSR